MQDRVSNRPEREKAERLAERIELLAVDELSMPTP
jgi:hypothetical protein